MNASIQAFLETQKDRRGFRVEEKPMDLSDLIRVSKLDQKYKPAYKPRHKTHAKLLLKEAIAFIHEQNAYDDSSEFVVPVRVEGKINVDHFNMNLGLFANSIRTANGLAGFGSTWDARYDSKHGVVIMRCRSSIAD